MKISLLHPSRGRPDKSLDTAMDWITKAGTKVELIISLDYSDPTFKRYEKSYLNFHLIEEYDRCPYYGGHKDIYNDNTCVVEATNHAAKEAKGDILVYLSDDFKCPDNWGQLVLKEFENENRPLLIKVDDCLQKFEVPVLTIPIMNRALYERLGYFWHPSYKSMWVDCDLYETAKRINAIKLCPHLKFEHMHPSVGKSVNDETYTRSAGNWDQGLIVFNERKKLNFPI